MSDSLSVCGAVRVGRWSCSGVTAPLCGLTGARRHNTRLSGIDFGERPMKHNPGLEAQAGVSERARAIEAEFSGTLVSAPASDNILLEMWEKFVMIGAMAGMKCLFRGTVGEIVATQDGTALMSEALAECRAIAAAAGFAPRPQTSERLEAMLTEPGSVNSASMRHDLEAGRRTEADAIVGDMLRRARRFHIETPLLRAAWCHLQVHENRLAARRYSLLSRIAGEAGPAQKACEGE